MTTASTLTSAHSRWQTSPEYLQQDLTLSLAKFLEVNDLLLENPNLNSTHLFRADILADSANTLKTTAEKEAACSIPHDDKQLQLAPHSPSKFTAWSEPILSASTLERTILRRLIPRKPQIDEPLEQTCYVCRLENGGYAVAYVPHVEKESNMPWYHPPVRALAYVYEPMSTEHNLDDQHQSSAISIHFLPFQDQIDLLPPRLHRTFLSLLQTFVRLARHPSKPSAQQATEGGNQAAKGSMTPSALKDTILPQHIVQDTYTRLKQQYASDLISRWVEKTEPSKHVFEDLSIAAFLIELWKQMYFDCKFPGFVDIACGNGVLVYILLQEGYHGRGFDARRRKTWEILQIDDCLEEKICVPKPFLDAIDGDIKDMLPDTDIHDGIFAPGTFIISNHADELTPWTPILAALSSPRHPLPFLAIPCCSHALSGAKHRYTPKDAQKVPEMLNRVEHQPAQGDLKALRAAKAKAANPTDDKSKYACLTKKVVVIAEEVGFDVELTLMRIPSTRNIGIVGNRKKLVTTAQVEGQLEPLPLTNLSITDKVQHLIERECEISGGIQASAHAWIESARKLQTGKGRGKVNLGRQLEHS